MSAPLESSGGPKATSGGLSMRILRVKGSFTVVGTEWWVRLSGLGEADELRFGFSIDPRRGGFIVQSMDLGTMFISLIFIMNAQQRDENGNFFGVWEGNNGAENSAEELNTFIVAERFEFPLQGGKS